MDKRTCELCYRQEGTEGNTCPVAGGWDCVDYRIKKFSGERDEAYRKRDGAVRELDAVKQELAMHLEATHVCSPIENIRRLAKDRGETNKLHVEKAKKVWELHTELAEAQRRAAEAAVEVSQLKNQLKLFREDTENINKELGTEIHTGETVFGAIRRLKSDVSYCKARVGDLEQERAALERDLLSVKEERNKLTDQLAYHSTRLREERKEAEETRQFLKTITDTLSARTAGTEGGPLNNPLEMISRLVFLANKAQVAQSNRDQALLTELADANASVGSLREERSRLRKLFTDIGMTAETPLEDCLSALIQRRDALYYDLQGYKRETRGNPSRLEIAATILARAGGTPEALRWADELIKAEQEFSKDKG